MFSSILMPWDFALILIFLAVAVPWLGRRRMRQLLAMPETTKIDRLSLYASTIAFQSLAAALILWRSSAHRISALELGLAIPRPFLTIVAAVALSALILLNQISSLRRLARDPSVIKGLLPELALKVFPQDEVERLAFFALVTTVAVSEEVIYRGFLQFLFESRSGGLMAVGIVGSAIMFALAHLYQGRSGLLSTSILGLVFSAVRALTASLVAPMMAHFVADLAAGLLAPGKVRAALRAGTERAGGVR